VHPLLSEFEQTCARQPDRPAACDQSLALDYKGFRAVAAGLAAQIAAQTRQPRVGIVAPTSAACAAAIFACWYAGKVSVPLNFLLGPEELAKIIRDAELDLVVTIERFAPNLAGTGLRTLLLNAQTLVPGNTAAPMPSREMLPLFFTRPAPPATRKGFASASTTWCRTRGRASSMPA